MRRLLPAAILTVLVVAGAAVAPPVDAAGPAGPASAAKGWGWPLPAPRVIVRPFIAPATAYSAGHRGIDIHSATTAVVAPADGVVRFAGVVVDRPVLSIAHDGGLVSSFEPVTTTLTAGALVHRGEVVGTLVAGHCSRPCLHFGVRRDGEYVSPLLFLGGIPRSVLLPTRKGARFRRADEPRGTSLAKPRGGGGSMPTTGRRTRSEGAR